MQTPAQTQAQPVSYWDKVDEWGHASEKKRREAWVMQAEQDARDAMFRAEVCGSPSLMERAARPCVFLIVAGVVACLIVAAGRGMGWIQ